MYDEIEKSLDIQRREIDKINVRLDRLEAYVKDENDDKRKRFNNIKEKAILYLLYAFSLGLCGIIYIRFFN